MGLHLVAYTASVLTAGGLATFPPVPDSTIGINGDAIQIPGKYNKIAAAAALVTYGTMTQAQLRAPSLRELFFPDLSPLIVGTGFGRPAGVDLRFTDPEPLATNEGMTFLSDGGGDGTTAGEVYGLVWLSDGAVQRAKGVSHKLRATTAISAQVGGWENGAITFAQTLPVGTYQIVGLRAMAAGLIAARLVFLGALAVTRPGVPGVGSGNVVMPEGFGRLEAGVLGEFTSTSPPSMDVLGGSSTAQVYEFDLIKTA